MTDEIVSGETTTYPFSYMYKGAEQMLRQAKESGSGQFYNIISCLIYCAFTLEAYFNHLGSERNSEWNEVERKISKEKKYELFCKNIGLEIDLAKRPYKSMIDVFRYRNQMAHGKTTTDAIKEPIEGDADDLYSFAVGPDWKTYSTIENAQTVFTDIKHIILELHKASGFANDPFLTLDKGHYRIKTTKK
jgi:hypothetical protein